MSLPSTYKIWSLIMHNCTRAQKCLLQRHSQNSLACNNYHISISIYIHIYMYICNLFSMCANSHWNSTYIYMYEVNRMLKFIYVCYYLFPSPKHELTWELCKICFTALHYAYKPIILQIQCSRLCPIFDHANIMNRSYSFRINP